MRVRAIRDLTQLGDRAFITAIAEGLDLTLRNVNRLRDGAVTLAEASQPHAARVLAMLAEEEAAKFLILLDAVRCPRLPAERLSHHLARFNDHLAKGLYARMCGMRPVTLAQLQEYADNDREDFYLDGPNDVDWMFRNQVIQGREGTLYVDYVAHEDEHSWSDPAQFEDVLTQSRRSRGRSRRFGTFRMRVVRRPTRSPSSPRSGAQESRRWRRTAGRSGNLNHLTLQVLDERGLLRRQPDATYAWIVREWQFPMYDLDLREIKVDRETLRQRQRSCGPDFY